MDADITACFDELAHCAILERVRRRIADKRVLAVDKERQPFRFTPLVTRERLLRQRVRDFVGTFFGGRPVDLALRLVEGEPLSEESIQQLEAALRRHKEARKRRKGGGGGQG